MKLLHAMSEGKSTVSPRLKQNHLLFQNNRMPMRMWCNQKPWNVGSIKLSQACSRPCGGNGNTCKYDG